MGNERQHYLDGIRALAIAGVVLVHTGQLFASLPPVLENLASYGAKGVQLFFLASGFTLGLTYFKRQLNVKEFFIRRFFRIAPMFYVGAIIYAIFGVYTTLHFRVAHNSVIDIVLTSTFLHGWLPLTANHSVPGGWSIGAEAMFYTVFPLLYYLFRSKSLYHCVALVILTFIIGYVAFLLMSEVVGSNAEERPFPYFFWITQLPAFVLGLSLSKICGILPRRFAFYTFYFTLLMIAFVAIIKSPLSNFFVADFLFGLLVLSASSARPALVENPMSSYIGTVSFSVYIVHFSVANVVEYFFPSIAHIDANVLQLFSAFMLVFCGSIAVSSLTYRFIEQPMIIIGRHVAYMYRSKEVR